MANIISILELRNHEIELLSFRIAYYRQIKPNGRPASRPLQAGFAFTCAPGTALSVALPGSMDLKKN